MEAGQPFNPYGLLQHAAIPRCVCALTRMNSSAKVIYGLLVLHCGEDGEVYPSQEKLAEEAGISKGSVRLAIDQLIAAKLIKVVKPTGRERLMHLNNKYLFLWLPEMENSVKRNRAINGAPHCQPASTPGAQPASSANKEESIKKNTSQPANAGVGTVRGGIPARFRRYAQTLYDALAKSQKGKPVGSPATWAKAIHLLHTVNKIPSERIKKAMEWYCDQLPNRRRAEFFLVIESGESFRKKFFRLEERMVKEQIASGEIDPPDEVEPENETTSVCVGVEEGTPENLAKWEREREENDRIG